MAISTYQAYLLKGTESSGSVTWSKLVDIKDFPDLGGAPEMLETTTLSDPMQTYISGIQKADAMEFTHNYTTADYATLTALKGATHLYAVAFGATTVSSTTTYGTNGLFKFQGQLDVYVTGAGVNEVVEMKSTIAPSTPIEYVAPQQ